MAEKEYFHEVNEVDIKQLEKGFMSEDTYIESHKYLVIPCHDVFIKYQEGILLVKRKLHPAKEFIWPIGGRILRGKSNENSLKEKVLQECSLDIENIVEMGWARTYFQTDPFDHGEGTDTLNIVYFADGKGNLKLNKLHKNPIIVNKEKYTNEFKETLHPYVRDFMNIAIELL